MDTIQLNKQKVSNYILESEINDLDIIQFLKLNIDKDLILVNVDKYNFNYTVKETEKSKSYIFPAILFSESELNEDINSNQKQESVIPNIFSKKHINWDKIIKFSIILILSLILIKNFIPSNANILTTWNFIWNHEIKQDIKIKNDFELLTEKANKNREVIAQKLQEQKRLRDLLKESIEQVKTLENTNSQIRDNLLQLSQ